MTVNELFQLANLFPSDPLPFGEGTTQDPSELRKGVYVIARVSDPTQGCEAGAMPLTVPPEIVLNPQYEENRWLPCEPVVYVGKTDRSIRKRVAEFRRQKMRSAWIPPWWPGSKALRVLPVGVLVVRRRANRSRI